jgi:hypothetical protein
LPVTSGTLSTAGSNIFTIKAYREPPFNNVCFINLTNTAEVIVNALPTPSFTVQPGATACANTDVTYTTQSGGGESNYIWSVPGILNTDYSVTSGGIGVGSSTVTLKWISAGSKTVTINYTKGGCTAAAASSSIATMVTATNTAGVASSTPTLCINTLLTDITHTTTGATGISNSGVSGANGLPAGVSAAWAPNTITISGIPTASGTFNYSIPLTGGCGIVNATGTITVTAANTAGVASSNPSLCINTLMTNITHTTTGATGISNAGVSGANGLPAGVSAAWAPNTITISGTPTASGTFNYSIPLTGGCGSVNATGTITVNPLPAAVAGSGVVSTCAGANGDGFSVTNNVSWTYSWTIQDLVGTVTAPGNTSSITINWLSNASIFVGADLNSTSVIKTVTATVTDPATGCATIIVWNVTIHRVPETGPQYHIPNNFGI